MIQRKVIGWGLVLVLVLVPQLLFAQEIGFIKPMIYGEIDKLQLLSPEIWLMEGKSLSSVERELLQVSYLRGLYDAFQLSNVGWASIYSILIDLAGTDLVQVREEMNRFYRDHSEMKDIPPSIVLLEILPKIRKGLSPVEAGREIFQMSPPR
ncbi:MAG: hypothetical protein AB1502_00565 [Thermodesulfobacteriota bacterium]